MSGPRSDRDFPAGSMSAEGYESFVVRVLVTRETGTIVSGHVTHLTSGQQISFSKLDSVLAFIRRLAATTTCVGPDDQRWR
jgi:hypothetical protein